MEKQVVGPHEVTTEFSSIGLTLTEGGISVRELITTLTAA